MSTTKPDTRDLVDLLALSHVPRWSILPMYRIQSVAEHSYRVTLIFSWMTRQCMRAPGEGVGPSPDYTGPHPLLYALAHDVEESKTGDIPGPAKRSIDGYIAGCRYGEQLKNIDHLGWDKDQRDRWGLDTFTADAHQNIRLRIKLADLIEAYTWLQRWGNPCDHKHRVLVELWADVKDLCNQLELVQPKSRPVDGWFELAKWVRDALVYEPR